MKIYIKNNQTDMVLTAEAKAFIIKAVKAVAKAENLAGDFEVSVYLCGEDEIRELNKKYRNKDKVTDVLSFSGEDDIILGDIVICAKRACEQAYEYGHSVNRELAFLTVHSMLHLLGYDHEEDTDRMLMEELQKTITDKVIKRI